jgi:RNA polymerase sigma-54 factor
MVTVWRCRLVRDHFHKLHHHKLPDLAKELGLPVESWSSETEAAPPARSPPRGDGSPPQCTVYRTWRSTSRRSTRTIIIRFNDDGLPQLRINRQYRQMMESKETSKRDPATTSVIGFVQRSTFCKNIEHRKQTIYKVCERIVERQRDFLDHGVEHIKPMMLKDISEDIGMHLSTVSRVVNGEYAHTPQG